MNRKAFTLAETLITLTILGVVAAVVVCNIISSYQKIANITMLKKSYSRISNAFEETLILNRCLTVKCVLDANNVPYNDDNNIKKNLIDKLSLFLPELNQYNNDTCLLKKDIYDLNDNYWGTTNYDKDNPNDVIVKGSGASTFHRSRIFCLKDYTILAPIITNMSDSIDYRCTAEGGKGWNCGSLYIYTGGRNEKIVMGKNLFLIHFSGTGEVYVPTNANFPCDINHKEKYSGAQINGTGCLNLIMKNNWKTDY